MIWLKPVAMEDGLSSPEKQMLLHQEGWDLLLEAFSQEYGWLLSPGDFEKTGKPYLPGWEGSFNISHCHGIVVCALYQNAGEIGIDVERLRPFHASTARKCFTDQEKNMLKNSENPDLFSFLLWTRKESWLKMTGKGLAFPMNQLEVLEDCGALFSSWHVFFGKDSYLISLCAQKPLSGSWKTEKLEELKCRP